MTPKPIDPACDPVQVAAIERLNVWMSILHGEDLIEPEDRELRDTLQELIENYYYS